MPKFMIIFASGELQLTIWIGNAMVKMLRNRVLQQQYAMYESHLTRKHPLFVLLPREQA